LPDDERAAIERHIRELDRLSDDLEVLDREIAEGALDDGAINRLLTITGVNLTVAAGLVAAIGNIARFKSPQKLVSYFGLNPREQRRRAGAKELPALCRSMASTPAERPSARAPQSGRQRMGGLAALAADTPRFASRSLALPINSTLAGSVATILAYTILAYDARGR
jgi:transposase